MELVQIYNVNTKIGALQPLCIYTVCVAKRASFSRRSNTKSFVASSVRSMVLRQVVLHSAVSNAKTINRSAILKLEKNRIRDTNLNFDEKTCN